MTDVVGSLAAVVTADGVLAGLVVLVAARRGYLALRVALELRTAAGLRRLSGNPSVPAVATAAAVPGLRQLLGWAQRRPAAGSGRAPRIRGRAAPVDWRSLLVPQWTTSARSPREAEERGG